MITPGLTGIFLLQSLLLAAILSVCFFYEKGMITKSFFNISMIAILICVGALTSLEGISSPMFWQLKPGAEIPMLILKGNSAKDSPKDAASTTDQNKQKITLAEKVADAYGVDNFSKIKSLEYTFNVKFNGKIFSRSWKWNPKTKIVTYTGKDKNGKEEKVTYDRNKPISDSLKKIDAGFINDQYWLLFPFHLVWDGHVDIKDLGLRDYPIGKGKGMCLTVKYTGNVGYTPGDEFDLYLDKTNHIHQWVYKHGGDSKNPRPATWEGNKDFGGITISTQHKGPGGKFKLWFSNVKVKYEK